MLAMDDYITALTDDHLPDDLDEASDDIVITTAHFAAAIEKTTPSVTEEMHEYYDDLAEELGGHTPTSIDESWIGFQ